MMKLILEGGDSNSNGCVAGLAGDQLCYIFQILHDEADNGGR